MNDDTGTPSPCLSPSNSEAVALERSSSRGTTSATRSGGGVALLGAGPGLCRLDLAVLVRSARHEAVEQLAGCGRDGLDGPVERLLVRPRRLGGAADLADVLERGGLDLLLAGGGLEVMKSSDVSAHASQPSGRACAGRSGSAGYRSR